MLSGFVIYDCGSVVYKASKAVWFGHGFLHMGSGSIVMPVEKTTPFTQTFAQAVLVFWTLFQQQNYEISSVFSCFLHTIHTPYKNYYRLYKGVY